MIYVFCSDHACVCQTIEWTVIHRQYQISSFNAKLIFETMVKIDGHVVNWSNIWRKAKKKINNKKSAFLCDTINSIINIEILSEHARKMLTIVTTCISPNIHMRNRRLVIDYYMDIDQGLLSQKKNHNFIYGLVSSVFQRVFI